MWLDDQVDPEHHCASWPLGPDVGAAHIERGLLIGDTLYAFSPLALTAHPVSDASAPPIGMVSLPPTGGADPCGDYSAW